jgi:CheY-like chemotaxis protein
MDVLVVDDEAIARRTVENALREGAFGTTFIPHFGR